MKNKFHEFKKLYERLHYLRNIIKDNVDALECTDAHLS